MRGGIQRDPMDDIMECMFSSLFLTEFMLAGDMFYAHRILLVFTGMGDAG